MEESQHTALKAKAHVFANDDLKQVLDPPAASTFSMTKIAITVGPACQSVDALCELLEAGATCARIDLTWAPIEYHRISLANLQEAMRRTRRLCAVMLDSLGRELMVRRKYGVDENGWPGIFDQLVIRAGAAVTITTDPAAECTPALLPVTYPRFPEMCEPGDSVFVGRYLVTGSEESSLFLEVVAVREAEVECVAKNNAVLDGLLTIFHQERSAEGLSNLQNDLPALTDFDRQAVAILASEFEVDFLSVSYARGAEDVAEARAFLDSIGAPAVKVFAKCETRQALVNYRAILAAADGVIISRGNLGLDVAPEKVAMVQKAMAGAAALLGRPTLITRVVDSMIRAPRPTRAEATDVANAVLDGVDGILLGAETYRGAYALDAVRVVAAICREAEAAFDHHNHFEALLAAELEAEGGGRGAGSGGGSPTGAAGHGRALARSFSGLSAASDGDGRPAWAAPAPAAGGRPTASAGPAPYAIKVESVAQSAVKAADKVGAALIIVVTYTGNMAGLVAKYRPKMPIMTLVVPYLRRDGMRWQLEGRAVARQALLTCGLMPVLAAPTPSAGEGLIEEAVLLAARAGVVRARDHVVVVSRNSNHELLVKVLSVDAEARGIMKIRPKSLLDMMRAAGQIIGDGEGSEDGA